MAAPALTALGNLIGGSSYFGQCSRCGTQFMSTHDRVVEDPNNPLAPHRPYACERCAPSVTLPLPEGMDECIVCGDRFNAKPSDAVPICGPCKRRRGRR